MPCTARIAMLANSISPRGAKSTGATRPSWRARLCCTIQAATGYAHHEFRAAAPIKGLEPTLPSSWYYDEAIFRRERERIFYREWFCVGREEELPAPGDHKVMDIAGESILVVRNRDASLRAFYNVCRHRGARLCRTDDAPTPGMAVRGGVIAGRSIICPYHQWSYDLDGQLIAAPHMSGLPGFDKGAIKLYPVGVECWGGFIFLHLTPGRGAALERAAWGHS